MQYGRYKRRGNAFTERNCNNISKTPGYFKVIIKCVHCVFTVSSTKKQCHCNGARIPLLLSEVSSPAPLFVRPDRSLRQCCIFMPFCSFLHWYQNPCYTTSLRDLCPQPGDDLIVHCPIIQICSAVLHHIVYDSFPSTPFSKQARPLQHAIVNRADNTVKNFPINTVAADLRVAHERRTDTQQCAV